MAKFMLSLRDESYQLILSEARERGISVQELLRAVVVPEWVGKSLRPAASFSQPAKEGVPRSSKFSSPSLQPDPFLKVRVSRSRA